MGSLYDRFNVEPIKGRDITIGEHFPQVFISESDEVFCYTGICLNEAKQYEESPFMQPFYMHGLHSTDKTISIKIKSFYRLVNGCIVLDDYLDSEFYNDSFYKKIDCSIRFPYPDNYYSILINHQEDKDLTRAVFGLTAEELTTLLQAYSKTMGTYNEYYSYPKLTRSPRNTNFCDITNLWIPARFPYIAFAESGYDFSHVSLFCFYRHIQLLTGYKTNSTFAKALLMSGANESILDKIFNIRTEHICRTAITYETISNRLL